MVSRAISKTPGTEEVLVHTGQHFDANMSEVFFQELEIPLPKYHLNISGGTHCEMIGRMLVVLEEVINKEKPERILVYGDSNSTLAGTLAATRLHTPIAHVEAGLRSFNQLMPEEINRVVADHLADLLLSPTTVATANLLHEGISKERIHQVGDVMYDATLYYGNKAEERSRILTHYGLSRGEYVLATVHRQENTDFPKRLSTIFRALRAVARVMPVALPLHPRTRQCIADCGDGAATDGLIVLPPLGYLDMVMLERNAAVIATDSGGVQKEAYFHCVPCVTLRDETEWTELVEMCWNRLAPPGQVDIAERILQAINSKGSIDTKPYGSGDAASKIGVILQGKY